MTNKPTVLQSLKLGGRRELQLLQYDDLLVKAGEKYAVGIRSPRSRKAPPHPHGAYAGGDLRFYSNKRAAEKDYNTRKKEFEKCATNGSTKKAQTS